MDNQWYIVLAAVVLLVVGYVDAHTETPLDCTVTQNESGIYCIQNNASTGGAGITARYLNVTGETDFYHSNVSNIRNIIGDHLHIITNESADDYFNTFSAGDSTNISSIRVSSNATTIASMEQCSTGCHAYSLSWIRVWSNYIDVSTKNVYFTGNITVDGLSGSGDTFVCAHADGTLFTKNTACR